MKTIILWIFLFFCTVAASADSYQSFSNIVDFKATMKDLIETPSKIDTKRLYLLDGTISTIRIISSDKEKFYAEIEFINSEWVGTETIKTYRIVLIFSKNSFAALFPDKLGQRAGIGQIAPNIRALALIQYNNKQIEKKDGLLYAFTVQDFRMLR